MGRNFGWFIKNRIAVMGRPGGMNDLEDDLLFLRRAGINKIVSLTLAPINEYETQRFFFEVAHIPIPDGAAPTIEQIKQFSSVLNRWTKKGNKVVVHCGAGYGRSGTMLACYLVGTGLASGSAIDRVRQFRPHAIETREQEKCVIDYEFYRLQKGPEGNESMSNDQ